MVDNNKNQGDSKIDTNAQIDLISSGNAPANGIGPIGRKAQEIRGLGKYGPIAFFVILAILAAWLYGFLTHT